tara:strand:+ start:821 stop:1270 length:450 start_codon:yes stop_codon:yes gene_type:complete
MNLQNTVEFIKKAHAGQVDKRGEPYYLHPIAVMNKLPSGDMGASTGMKMAALLHDVLEDTKYTAEDLEHIGFSEYTIKLVRIVSRNKSETYFDYIQSIVDSNFIGAVLIKKADLEHNLDPRRSFLGGDSLKKRYEKALEMINASLNNIY